MIINFEKGYLHFDKVMVVIKRDSKGNIIYNSGLLYLTKQNHRKMVQELKGEDVEFKDVNVYGDVSENYPRDTARGKLWCPYCMTLEKWSNHQCPICGMSDREFWVQKHNYTWKEKAI